MTLAITTNSFGALYSYLKQYMKIATGDRVEFVGRIGSFSNSGFYKFLCGECKQNWNVSVSLFNGSNGTPFTIPTELTDWLSDHRHICKSSSTGTATGTCTKCLWPSAIHPAPMPDPQDYYSLDFIKDLKPFQFNPLHFNPAYIRDDVQPAPENKNLEEHTGRKFR